MCHKSIDVSSLYKLSWPETVITMWLSTFSEQFFCVRWPYTFITPTQLLCKIKKMYIFTSWVVNWSRETHYSNWTRHTLSIILQCSAEAVFAGRGTLPIFRDALPFLKSWQKNLKGRASFHDDDEMTPSTSWDKTAAALKLFTYWAFYSQLTCSYGGKVIPLTGF